MTGFDSHSAEARGARRHQVVRDGLFEKVFARIFVYSILFEDSDVDCRHLELSADSRVLSIAGAGCGVAAMPSFQPRSLDVVDTNRAHLSLTALKTFAPRYLSYDEFFQLFAIGRTPDARGLIARVMDDAQVTEPIRRHWRGRRSPFRRGLYRSGLSNRMTQGLSLVCRSGAEWITEVATLAVEERVQRVREDVLRRLRWPGVRQVATSPLQLLSMGINFRQKARIERAERASLFEHIERYLQRMSRTDMMRNWFIWVPLAGCFNHSDELAMPPYLRRAFYGRNRSSRTAVRMHHSGIVPVMQAARDDSWTHVNCGDVLDWMDSDGQKRFLNLVHAKTAPGGRVLIRSVEKMGAIERHGLEAKLRRMRDVSERAVLEDRSCLYRSVDFYEVV